MQTDREEDGKGAEGRGPGEDRHHAAALALEASFVLTKERYAAAEQT